MDEPTCANAKLAANGNVILDQKPKSETKL